MRSGVRMRSAWLERMQPVLFVLAVASAACGTDLDAPLNPAAPSLYVVPVVQVAGQWKGVSTLDQGPVTGVIGSLHAACVGDDIQRRLPAGISEPVAMTLSQHDSDVYGRLTTASGVACSYNGKASRDAITMDSASCKAPVVLMRCSETDVHELELVESSVSGAVALPGDSTITGTVTNTYNVWEYLDEKKKPVGSVILNYSYSVSRH